MEYSKELLRKYIRNVISEEFSLSKQTKDILDDVTDEKIGTEEYFDYIFKDDLGGRAVGTIKIENGKKVANIIQMNSQPFDKIGTEELKKRGFFSDLIKELKKDGVETLRINLQSEDTRNAVKRLIEKGVLKNPRSYKGISVDEYPSTFSLEESSVLKESW